jgi:Domain of unknown function (DUF4268)
MLRSMSAPVNQAGVSSPAALATLKRIDEIRDVWKRERDFSDWLLHNGEELENILGIEIELERPEEPVGDFRLDLIGRDETNGEVLMVENQLETSDHGHLGQVLLYAAGTDAGTIVWIARSFRPEHRQALNWLNENTDQRFHFFGVEVTAVSIGSSPVAPLLSLVVQPSDWQKQIRQQADARSVSGKGKYYLRFWGRFLARIEKEHPTWTQAGRAPGPGNWIDMPSLISGSHMGASFARPQRLRYELYIGDQDPENNLALFNALEAQREQLDASYGRPLTYEELPERKACRIADYREGVDVTDEAQYDDLIDWLFDCGERFRKALQGVHVPA